MLVSRNAFERYRGLGARQKEAGIPSTSSQFKKKKTQKNATKKAPPAEAHSRYLLSAAPADNEQVVEPKAAWGWEEYAP